MRALVPEGLSTVQDALVCANDDEFLVVGNFDQVIKILRSL